MDGTRKPRKLLSLAAGSVAGREVSHGQVATYRLLHRPGSQLQDLSHKERGIPIQGMGTRTGRHEVVAGIESLNPIIVVSPCARVGPMVLGRGIILLPTVESEPERETLFAEFA